MITDMTCPCLISLTVPAKIFLALIFMENLHVCMLLIFLKNPESVTGISEKELLSLKQM